MEKRDELLAGIQKLANYRPNDAVKLAFFSEKDIEKVDGLDLSAVTEFKRGKDGGMEMKFVDRLETLKWLLEQVGEDPRAEKLYRALEETAKQQAEAT